MPNVMAALPNVGYDHPLPRYSIIAADTLRDLVTF